MKKIIEELNLEFKRINRDWTILVGANGCSPFQNSDSNELNKANGRSPLQILKNHNLILINLFAMENTDTKSTHTLFYVFEKRTCPDLLIIKLNAEEKISTISTIFPNAVWYEREITDGFGIKFIDAFDERKLFLHEIYPDDFHPLKKSFENQKISYKEKIDPQDEYKFKEVTGEGVYQIPVGPVHAGIIEPGHFRFNVIGETIFNLELRMFWKHRGIEKLAEDKTPEETLKLAESISGDESLANALGFVMAIETLAEVQIPKRANYLRLLFAELERVYSLLGDLAGMILDVAYPVGANNFFILREEILRFNEKLTGSRFLKNSLKIGGFNFDLEQNNLTELTVYLKSFLSRFKKSYQKIMHNYGILDRFETTGIIEPRLVAPMNLSGPLARSSGTQNDVRLEHPYGAYSEFKPKSLILEKGDVLARFKVKAATILDSINLIKQVLKNLPDGEISINVPIKDGESFSLVESVRGQNMHFVSIEKGKISRYKVRTASFCNWPAIEHAVINNIVPDFPLINKSLNLSYAGMDL